jgi:hypothetical protein
VRRHELFALVDLSDLRSTELDLSVLDKGTAHELTKHDELLQDPGSTGFHFPDCTLTEPGAKPVLVPNGNRTAHYESCCGYSEGPEDLKADALSMLVIMLRETGPHFSDELEDLARTLEVALEDHGYEPLHPQVRSRLADLRARLAAWVLQEGEVVLTLEAARRSLKGYEGELDALDKAGFFVPRAAGEALRAAPQEPDLDSVAEAALSSLDTEGHLLVHLDRASLHCRTLGTSIVGYDTTRDAFEAFLTSPDVAIVPKRLLPLTQYPYSFFQPHLGTVDITGEDPRVVETACQLLADGGSSAPRAVEVARELV